MAEFSVYGKQRKWQNVIALLQPILHLEILRHPMNVNCKHNIGCSRAITRAQQRAVMNL